MKSIRIRFVPLLRILACGSVMGFTPPVAHGQIPGLKKVLESSQPAVEKPASNSEDDRKRLETWLQEARQTVTRFESAGFAATLPEGITNEEFEDRRRDVEQMIQIANVAIKNLNSVEDGRAAAESARSGAAAWNGFKDPPPYSILMIDELLNERDAVKAQVTSNQSSLTNLEGLLASVMEEVKSAEDKVNAAIAAVQTADEKQAAAAKWRLETARGRARLLALRAGFLKSSAGAAKERINASTSDLELIERQIKVAAPNSRFTEEDLARIEKISNDRKRAVEKEVATIAKRLTEAATKRRQAKSALDAMLASASGNEEPEGLDLVRFRHEVAESKVDSLQTMIDSLESLVQLENLVWKAHQDRFAVLTAGNPEARDKALASLGILSDRLRAWLNVLDNEMNQVGAELGKIESRAASITSEDPRFSLINEQRAACSEKLAILQRASQNVTSQRKIIRRWIADYSPKPDEAGFFERAGSLAAKSWDTVKKIWSFEIISFENRLEVDGEIITGRIPITLGTLLRALLFFIVGYWLTSHIANRIQRGLVARGHIAEPQAKNLRNWAMIVVGAFLVIGTLSFLKIPLTVFAFFGGALAIGIGFGTQTLIKNFISGIIVLAERKIRVGDILDVDGIVGTVIEVNTRSSVIRSADDVETMIPNSLFLENRVTNWTLSSRKVRRNLRVGVAYGTNPQAVMEILTDCAGRHGLICKSPAPFGVFEDFGDNALVFVLYFWVEMAGSTNAMIVTSDLRIMIEKRLSEAGIGVPYPQRDMHLTTDKPIEIRMAD
jgi:small-conductance mechanosensitive channel